VKVGNLTWRCALQHTARRRADARLPVGSGYPQALIGRWALAAVHQPQSAGRALGPSSVPAGGGAGRRINGTVCGNAGPDLAVRGRARSGMGGSSCGCRCTGV